MMLKTGVELAHEYTVFNHGSPRQMNNVMYLDIMMFSGRGFNSAPKLVFPGNSK